MRIVWVVEVVEQVGDDVEVNDILHVHLVGLKLLPKKNQRLVIFVANIRNPSYI